MEHDAFSVALCCQLAVSTVDLLPEVDSLSVDLSQELPCYLIDLQQLSKQQLGTNAREADIKISYKEAFYGILKDIQSLMNKRAKSASGADKDHYSYLAFEINNAIGK